VRSGWREREKQDEKGRWPVRMEREREKLGVKGRWLVRLERKGAAGALEREGEG
jgi:hypothetical protein